MDVSLLVRQRLIELGFEQKDLASAANVTESYISQLLARKKVPPAPGRTDIYEKIGKFLRLPSGELAKLAELQRREEWKKKIAEPSRPLFEECRGLILLRKCAPTCRAAVQRIFEKDPFGELERLVTQKLLDVAQGAAREELENEEWLRAVAQKGSRSYEQMRVAILEFLDTDVFNISVENCVSFMDPMIESWDIDLRTFGLEVILNCHPAARRVTRFEFTEKKEEERTTEPGLEQFLDDGALSAGITEVETEFLRSLKFSGKRPSPLYFYRELQNLRDPLHFSER